MLGRMGQRVYRALIQRWVLFVTADPEAGLGSARGFNGLKIQYKCRMQQIHRTDMRAIMLVNNAVVRIVVKH